MKRFGADGPVCLVLDGIYEGGNFEALARRCASVTSGATIMVAQVDNPQPFGWIRMDPEKRKILEIKEKPKPTDLRGIEAPYLVQTHMYFYGPEVFDLARSLTLSGRNEYEVTELHNLFHGQGSLKTALLHDTDRILVWDDAGTAQRLLNLSNKVHAMQTSVFMDLIGSPHLQALRNGWITLDRIREICEPFLNKGIEYYDMLMRVAARKRGTPDRVS